MNKPSTREEVASIIAACGNAAASAAEQWAEVFAAREGLPEGNTVLQKAENERIEAAQEAHFRAILNRYVPATEQTDHA